jgi:hypothetical protein
MSRHPDNRVRLAAGPRSDFYGPAITATPPPLAPLLLGRGPNHIVVLTADGARGYGMLHQHSADALDALDALLDYRDAANEDADGRLPHERGDYVAPAEQAQVVPIQQERSRNTWTPERIIAAIHAWHRSRGRPPGAHEWAARTAACWPAPQTVARHFGSWNAAIVAAGYESRTVGGYRRVDVAA